MPWHATLAQRFYSATLLLCWPALALSSVSTRAAGLAWFFMSLAGLAAWASRRQDPLPAAARPDAHLSAAHAWVLACGAAFVWMAIPTAYWGAAWDARHAQWRLLIGALGVWLVVRYQPLSARALWALSSAAALSCLLAYGLTVTVFSHAAPTNRIPWMAGLSVLACTLLGLSYAQTQAPLHQRQLWLAASASMLVTVLLGGVRGSWPLLPVWIWGLWRQHRQEPALWQSLRHWLLPVLALMLLAGLARIPESDNPLIRLQSAVLETTTQNHPDVNQDTSGAVRLWLYETSIQHLFDHPWLGLGPVETRRLIHDSLEAAGAHQYAKEITHMHNDLLQPWVEFGVWGLLGYLTYAAGLLMLIRTWRQQPAHPTAIGMTALLAVHIITGQTSMNFGHNYYPVMLAISVGLGVWGWRNKSHEVSILS